MIPNIHQSVDEIIKAASQPEKILWQQARLITGEYGAIQQLYFCGSFAGTEFLTYSANKLYLAIELEISGSSSQIATTPLATLYNTANAVEHYLSNMGVYWDATAAALRMTPFVVKTNNVLFSRLAITGSYITLKFIGYKIAY